MAELFQGVTNVKRSLDGTDYIDKQDNWPKTAGTFGAALRRIAPSLRKMGVSISEKTVRGKDLHSIDASEYFNGLRDEEQRIRDEEKREKKRLREQTKLNKRNFNNTSTRTAAGFAEAQQKRLPI